MEDDFNNSKMQIGQEKQPTLNEMLTVNSDTAPTFSDYASSDVEYKKSSSEKENEDSDNEKGKSKNNTKMKENKSLKIKTGSSVIQVPITSSDELNKSYKKPYLYDKNTLKEPIKTTILRDLFIIFTKVKFVVLPFSKKEQKNYYIKQWDLWGPLLLNMFLACTLTINAKERSQIVILVFSIFWLGGIVMYLNAYFLGVKTSLFQLLCLFGYCLFPLNLSALILIVIKIDILRLIITGFTCIWSIYSSSDFLKSITLPHQRILVLYPCILFYLYFAWLIFTVK